MKFNFSLIFVLLIPSCVVFSNPIINKLDHAMEANNTLLCVGLDPDPNKMPLEFSRVDRSKKEAQAYKFLTKVVDATAKHVCAYKIQKAFFDVYDNGHELLTKVVEYIHNKYPHIPVFVDCKIGDTDNTMLAYMHNLFDLIQADGVVINPYMGDDVLEPFINDQNKVGIILVQTSNPNAKVIQELSLSNGEPLWSKVLDLTIHRWNKNHNLIPVLSSNSKDVDYKKLRTKIPQDMPILLAGVGLQGGDESVVRDLLNEKGRGVFVNSSRGILYPYLTNDPKWSTKVEQAAIELKDKLNSYRPVKQTKFILLMGPSGVGKSTLINELKKIDTRITYVTPFTTRKLRHNETDKLSISNQELEQMQASGLLLAVNEKYGIKYGTPKYIIDEAFTKGDTPILDWPIEKLAIMESSYPNKLFKVYVYTDSNDELTARLKIDNRDLNGTRLGQGINELSKFSNGEFDAHIDLKVCNTNGEFEKVAQEIYSAYIQSCKTNM